MKNMPEKDFWTNVKTRLEKYQEIPADDAWDKIAGALPARSRSEKSKRNMGIALLILLGTFSGIVLHQSLERDEAAADVSKQVDNVAKGETEISSATSYGNDEQQISNSTLSPDDSVPIKRRLSAKNPSRQNSIVVQHDGDGRNSSQSKNVGHARGSTVVSSGERSQGYRREQSQSVNSNVIVEPENLHATTNNTAEELNVTPHVEQDDEREAPKNTGHSDLVKDQHLLAADNDKVSVADSIRSSKKQSSEAASNKKKKDDLRRTKIFKGSVYAMLTPSLSFQKITPAKQDDVEVIDFESPGVMRKERFGWSFDAGFQSKLRKNLEWYAGLSYYQQQQTLSYRLKTDEYDVTQTNSGYTMTQKINTRSLSYNMRNIGASAGLFYTIKSGGLEHKFGAGLQFQTGLLSSSQEQSYNNKASKYFNYQLSYRLELPIKYRWNVFIQPSFVHAILSKEKLREPFELKPYRAGIGFGMIYRF